MVAKLQLGILKTLSYFDVFEYPLSRQEIWKYMAVKCDMDLLNDTLVDLLRSKMIFCTDNFFSLHDDPSLITRRKEGNRLGKIKLGKAMHISRFLGAFPFVEAVCISGSLSKDFATAESDLDYFIVTAPGRLWIARNLMHCFRKLSFLVNHQHSFCMNYYISSAHSEIIPQNYYTAIELSTLKAACVHRGVDEIFAANRNWIAKYLPNINLEEQLTHHKSRKWLPTRCVEWFIDKLGGNVTESFFYKTTMKRWAKKWNRQHYDVERCMLSAGRHFNTPVNYPVHLPDVILQRHIEIYKQAERKYIDHVSKLIPTIQVHEFY